MASAVTTTRALYKARGGVGRVAWFVFPGLVPLMWAIIYPAFGATNSGSPTSVVPLTSQEVEWLRAHGPIRYGPDPSFAPFEFIDVGRGVVGITPDLLNLVAQRLGAEIVPVQYRTWTEVLNAMKAGEIDLLGTLTRTAEREEYLDFTRPYLEVPVVLFVKKNSPFRSMKDFAGRRVGVVQDYGAHAWLKSNHPFVKTVPVPNTHDGFIKLALGEVDAMLEVLPVGQHALTKMPLADVRVLPEVYLTFPQHFAVAKGNKILLGILEKGLDAVTELERRKILSKWVGEEPFVSPSRIPPAVKRIALGVIAGLMLLGAWSVTLRYRVAQQEQRIRQNLEREAALEKRYKDLVENATDLIYAIDLQGRFILWNPAAERLLGYTHDEAIKLSIEHVVAPEYLPMVRKRMADKLVDGLPAKYELQVITKQGERRWIEVNTRLLCQNGNPVGVEGIGRDITDRKNVEQELKRSQLLYESLVENMPLCVFRKDRDGKFTFVNQGFVSFTGLTREKILGKTDFDLYPQHLAEKYRRDDVRVMETGEVYDTEELHKTPKGAQRWVRVVKSQIKDETGNVVGVQAVFWDVTERRLARESLRESLSLLQATLEASHEGILVVDRNRRVTVYNQRFLEMWRIPNEVISKRDGRFMADYVAPQLIDPEGFKAKLDELYNNLELTYEDVLVFKDGRVFERYTLPQRIGNKVVGRVWCFHDATARKRAEQERLRAEEQLRQSQKLEAVGRLAAGVAHDFNNILTAIMGNASLLESTFQLEPEARQHLRQIVSSAERAAKLTKQLMFFSRKQPAKFETVNLNDILSNMTKMLSRLIGEDIELICNSAPDLPMVKADPNMLEQVIINLVVNARDAMPKGGTLTLSTFAVDVDDKLAIEKGASKPGSYVCLSVTDTGIGMDPATQQHIFEPFFTTKEAGKGTGLGLSTVHGIVQQHGGWVEVESAVGKGSCFRVYLPAYSGERLINSESTQGGFPRGHGEMILLVEDEPAVRSVVEAQLTNLGYSVISFASGREALEFWPRYRNKIELLITDVVMPEGTSGLQLATRLLQDNPSLKVIYTSGYSGDLAEDRSKLPPGTRFLQKPYKIEELATTVSACLES